MESRRKDMPGRRAAPTKTRRSHTTQNKQSRQPLLAVPGKRKGLGKRLSKSVDAPYNRCAMPRS